MTLVKLATLIAALILTGVNAQALYFDDTTLSGQYIIDMLDASRVLPSPCPPEILEVVVPPIEDYGCINQGNMHEFMANVEAYLEIYPKQVESDTGWYVGDHSIRIDIYFRDGYGLSILTDPKNDVAALMGLQLSETSNTIY